MPLPAVELPAATPETLRAAVRLAVERQAADVAAPSVGPRSLSGRLPPADKLRASAESDEDSRAARYFSSILELSFLVASADGLDDGEREALARLVAHATGDAVTTDELSEQLADVARALDQEGRDARLEAVAGTFTDFVEREEALSFAALVALADGRLGDAEGAALLDLGRRFDSSEGEVQLVVAQVAASLRSALGSV